MGSFIFRQPNGKLGRYTTVTDSITHYNMTEDDYIELRKEQAAEDARWLLEHGVRTYDYLNAFIGDSFPGEMTKEEYKLIKKEMEA